jgi:hypothetical protein
MITNQQMRETIARRVRADYLVRLASWLLWGALVVFLVLPFAWLAYKQAGALVALLVLALMLGMTWRIKPQGQSYGARMRAIGREFPD